MEDDKLKEPADHEHQHTHKHTHEHHHGDLVHTHEHDHVHSHSHDPNDPAIRTIISLPPPNWQSTLGQRLPTPSALPVTRIAEVSVHRFIATWRDIFGERSTLGVDVSTDGAGAARPRPLPTPRPALRCQNKRS